MNSRQTILIVDDVEMNRAILDATFSEDYRILEAENGKQAMELIMEQQDRLAAILLDVIMPVMDGFEVLEEMQKLELTHKIPVFLITAENSQEVLKRGYEWACGYYRKTNHSLLYPPKDRQCDTAQ